MQKKRGNVASFFYCNIKLTLYLTTNFMVFSKPLAFTVAK